MTHPIQFFPEYLNDGEYAANILEQDKVDKIISKRSWGALLNAHIVKNKGRFENWEVIKRWLENHGYHHDVDNKLIIRD